MRIIKNNQKDKLRKKYIINITFYIKKYCKYNVVIFICITNF
jgi:hypothetical protein